MSRFLQLHVLTHYPPSNLNRDDTGRPKTALVGDAQRLRISSQSQKRAWRTSDLFETALSGHIGTRTKMLGKEVFAAFREAGVGDKSAREWSKNIAACFGKLKSDKKAENDEDLCIEQLVHIGPEERAAVADLVKTCARLERPPTEQELKLLTYPKQAVDIAMFGRMLADKPEFNVEAAVQVAHAITVHKAAVEDDYFSAVDDLNNGLEDKGAAHIGERGYGAGLFYLYICVNRELLRDNLGAESAMVQNATEALIHAVTKVSPTGMQNSFASRSYASYVLAEKGDQQPRTLAQAFLKPIKPVSDQNMLEEAVKALTMRRDNFDKVYDACASERCEFNVETGAGSMAELVAFARS